MIQSGTINHRKHRKVYYPRPLFFFLFLTRSLQKVLFLFFPQLPRGMFAVLTVETQSETMLVSYQI